jgi:predicted hydrocarbon binding protein
MTTPGHSMPRPSNAPRRLALPPLVLTHLRRALREEVGPLTTTHVLHDAGFSAGEEIYETFAAATDMSDDVATAEFWSALSRHLAASGWGTFEVERVHSGLGMIRAHDWAESSPGGSESQPGCHFSSGMFAALLGRAAGGPIAVLEVQCRSKGDPHCAFLYGSEAAVHEMYGLLLDGAPLDEALVEL